MSEHEMKTLAIDPETLVLTDIPCWKDHKRGKNWMAIIFRDATKPGGLERRFFPAAKGQRGYYLGGLSMKDDVPFAVEFGADYYSSSGKPSRTRVYGVVTVICPDSLEFVQTDTSAQACRLAKNLGEERKLRALAPQGDKWIDGAIDEDLQESFSTFSDEFLLMELVRRGTLVLEEGLGFQRYVSSPHE